MLNWKKVIVSTFVLLALDAAYLYSNMKMFSEQITKVQRVVMEFRPEGAVLCYLALVLAINYFILQQPDKTAMDAFILGVVIYAVYETTNYATLKKWSAMTVIMDVIWGGTLFATTTVLTNQICKKI